jgi:hypothetical protein
MRQVVFLVILALLAVLVSPAFLSGGGGAA